MIPDTGAPAQGTDLRVLVPRGGEPGQRLAAAVRAAGLTPVVAPLITFEPAPDPAALDAALRDLCDGADDWLVLTSERTVDALAARPLFDELLCAEVHVAAVGPSTAARAEELGLEIDLVPETDPTAAGLVAELTRLRPASALVPHSDLAGPELADGLRAADWQVREVVAYRTVTATELAPTVWPIGAVLLTSGSTARTWAALRPVPSAEALVICIGPRTEEAAVAAGLTVAAVAASPDAQALVAALTDALTRSRS